VARSGRAPAAATRLLAEVLEPERRRLSALVGVLVVASLLPLAGPILIGRVVDDALAGEPLGDLTLLAVAYLGITAAAEVLRLGVTWWSVDVAWSAGNRLRERLADHALRLDLAWHGRHPPGELISRIDGDTEALSMFGANVVIEVLGNLVLVVGVAVVAIAIDWRAGLVVTLGAAVAVGVMAALRHTAVAANEQEREATGRMYADLEERLGGLEDLRANGGGAYAVHRLHEASATVWRATRRGWGTSQVVYAASSSAFAVGSVATLAVGAWLERRGAVSIGAVLALFRYSQMIRTPLERMGEQLPELQRALAGTSRAARLLAEEPTIVDPPPDRARTLPAGPLTVDLDDVELAYDGEAPALRGIDLHLDAGTTLGVVGRSGSGKTSLGRLLLRFWDPTGGAVRLGGIDLRDVPARDLRHRVGVVTQDVELLRASVRDNLTVLGSVRATDERLRAVLADVGLDRWLASLPAGLDTVVGDGGAGLSAGEGQLLAFARAFLADPGLVVLDEASSRLDPVTEGAVTHATEALLAGRTAVVIAHRLSTLDRVDRIAVVDGGRVVEHGGRGALAADPTSRFAALLRTAGAAGLLADDEAVA
jgi:ABC-type multidrug transport system fused ATPase/permease subunit